MTRTVARERPLAIPLPRRGLKLEEAANYIGIGRTKFQELVNGGRMPRPRKIDGRLIWDTRELDVAFDDLPVEGEKSGGWAHGDD
jgi:predicted DNA-binding transcriptional regulator AlpA